MVHNLGATGNTMHFRLNLVVNDHWEYLVVVQGVILHQGINETSVSSMIDKTFWQILSMPFIHFKLMRY